MMGIEEKAGRALLASEIGYLFEQDNFPERDASKAVRIVLQAAASGEGDLIDRLWRQAYRYMGDPLSSLMVEAARALEPFSKLAVIDDRLAGLSPDEFRTAVAAVRAPERPERWRLVARDTETKPDGEAP